MSEDTIVLFEIEYEDVGWLTFATEECFAKALFAELASNDFALEERSVRRVLVTREDWKRWAAHCSFHPIARKRGAIEGLLDRFNGQELFDILKSHPGIRVSDVDSREVENSWR